MSRHPRKFLVLAAAVFAAVPLPAQTAISWNYAGTDFTAGASWTGGTAPASDLTTNTGSFGSAGVSGVYNATLDSNRSIAGLIMASGGNAGVNFGGTGTVTLGASGLNNARTTATTNNRLTLSNTLALGATSTFTSAGGEIQTTGTLNLGSFGLTLTGTGTGSNTLGGVISGTGTLTKSGTGTWILNAANTYSGTTTVTGGTLGLGSSGTLGTGNLTLNGGVVAMSGTFSRALGTGAGQVQFGASGGGFAAYGGALTVSSLTGTWGTAPFLPTGGILYLGSTLADNVVTLTNNFSLGTAVRTIDVADNTSSAADKAVISGILSGTGGGITKTGTGSLTLSGVNTYTGATTLSAGTLRASGSAAALGTGTLTLTSGTLELAGDTNLAFNRNTTAASGTTTVVDRVNAGAGVTHTLGTLSLNGLLTVNAGSNITSGTAGLTFGATTLTGAGSFYADTNTALTLGSVSGTNQSLTFSGSGNSAVTGAIAVGTGSLTMQGPGALTLSGVNTYTGGVNLQAGTLTVNSGASLAGATSLLTISGGTLNLNNAAQTVAGINGFSLNSIINLASGHTLTASSAADQTYVGVLAGAGALVKAGTGNQTLAGNNSYSGGTTITAGTLAVGSNTALGTGAVTLNGGTLSTSGSFSLSNPITLAANSTFFNNGSLSLLTLTGGLGESGGARTLTVTGGGPVLLTGSNTYTGTTTLTGGALLLGGAAALPSANLVLNGGTLGMSGTFSRGLGTGAGQVQFGTSSGGFAAYGGPLSITGFPGTPVWGTTTSFLGTGSLLFGSTFADNVVTWTNNFSLGTATRTVSVTDNTGSSADKAVISGIISSGAGGGLTKTGTGTLELTGANTYTGATTISAGTLVVDTLANGGTASGIGASTNVASNLALNGGTLRYTGGGASTDRLFSVGGNSTIESVGAGALNFTNPGSITLSSALTLTGTNAGSNILAPVLSGSGAVSKTGAGKWILSGNNTYTGQTTVDGGELVLNGSLAATTTVSINNTGSILTLNGPAAYTFAGLSGTGDATLALGSGRTLTVNNTSSSTFSGVITGASALVKSGTGTLTLNGVNSYSGGTIINAGTLRAGNNFALGTGGITLNGGSLGGGSSVVTISSPIVLSANSSLSSNLILTGGIVESGGARNLTIVAGSNTAVLLTGTNSYTGTTSLTGGSSGALLLSGSAALSSANLVVGGGVLGTSGTFSRGLGTGAGQVQFTGNGGFAAYGGSLSVTGFTGTPVWGTTTSFLPNGNTLYLSSSHADNVVTWINDFSLGASTRSISVSDNTSSGSDKAVISGVISGTGGISAQGAGLLELTAANTYTGATTVSNGMLALTGGGGISAANLSVSGGGVLGASGTFSRAAGTGAGQVQISGGGFAAYGGPLTINGFTGTPTWGSSALTGALYLGSPFANDVVTLANDFNVGSGLSVLVNDNAFSAADKAVISGTLSGTGSFTKSGPGTLELTGTNTYTSATQINAGILSVSSLADTGVSSNIGTGTGSSSIILNGGVLQYTGPTGSTNRPLSFNSAPWIDASGSGAITFSYAGTLGLGLVLQLSGTNSDTNTIAGTLTGVGSVTKSGSGTWQLTGANTYTGGTNLNGGTMEFSAGNNLGTGAINFNGGALRWAAGNTSDVSSRFGAIGAGGAGIDTNGNNLTFASALSGTGGLTKSGSGSLTLAGANTFTGATTISGGTLNLTGSIANNSLTTIANGASLTGAGALGDLSLAGTYAPGNSPALVSLGDFTMTGTGLLQMEIGGLGRGTDCDALDINGVFTAAGTMDVSFINGFTPVAAATFNLFDFASLTGTFATINLPTLGGSLTWDTTALYTLGELKIATTAVPEPSTCAVVAGLVCFALAAVRRRHRASS